VADSVLESKGESRRAAPREAVPRRKPDPAFGARAGRVQQLMEANGGARQTAARDRALNAAAHAGPPVHARNGNRTGLPERLKTRVEERSGHSLDDVRVRRNSSEPAAIGAHAFARGAEVHLAPGQERHLPHELWHVVQQKQGRVKPTGRANGVPVNDDPNLEREADLLSRAAVAPKARVARQASAGTAVAQRVKRRDPNLERLQSMLRKSKDPVLKKILAEAIATYSDKNVAVGYTKGGVSQTEVVRKQGARTGKYRVAVDEQEAPKGPHQESFLLHELTHVAVDRKYPIHAENPTLTSYNAQSQASVQAEAALRAAIVLQIEAQIERDRSLLSSKPAIYAHLSDRITRAAIVSQEFDTVITEMFYYISRRGSDAQKASGTFRQLRDAADAAFKTRNNRKPMSDFYPYLWKKVQLKSLASSAHEAVTDHPIWALAGAGLAAVGLALGTGLIG
jgi:hypothetical protein